jgi:sugar/nucleoside kinase (ribokinase family)
MAAADGGKRIVGVGSALVDILVHADDAFLETVGAVKGGMIYVDRDHIERTLAQSAAAPAVVPGGSACNTVVGVAQLGGRAQFVGTCGRGPMGRFYEDSLRGRGVEPHLFRSDRPTGRVLSIITPDAQRSMFTFLGAASETRPEDLRPEGFAGAAVVHIEGYLLFNPRLIRAALSAARAAGARVSLDLASFNVVEESRSLLAEIVGEFVDILIANEDEARSYTGETDPTRALEILQRNVDIAALKLGGNGSMVAHAGRVVRVPALSGGAIVDTTGAGDLWAAGFLYGLVEGYDLERCGEIASACGYEVCRVVGASVPPDGWDRVRKLLAKRSD